MLELEVARIQAHDEGGLSKVTAQLSACTGDMILRRARGEERPKQRLYSPEEVAFFGLILCAGGMAVLAFLR